MSFLIETLYDDYGIVVGEYGDSWHWAQTVRPDGSVAFKNTCPPDGFATAEEAAQDAGLACGLLFFDNEGIVRVAYGEFDPDYGRNPVELDAEVLASAGYGTDEDYGYYHDELERDHDEPYEHERDGVFDGYGEDEPVDLVTDCHD